MGKSGEDLFWVEAENFVKQYVQAGDRLLAPVKFKPAFPNLVSYDATYRQNVDQFEWFVIHKGALGRLNRNFLKQAIDQRRPVFANPVFVILTQHTQVPDTALNPQHWQAFLDQVNPVAALTRGSANQPASWQQRLKRWFGADAAAQASQLQAILDCTDRVDANTKQLQSMLDRVQQLEKTSRQLQNKLEGLQQGVGQGAWINSTPLAQMSWAELNTACRAACQTSYLGDHQVICRVLARYFLYGDTTDVGIVPHLCLNGYWEPWLTMLMLHTVKPGWHCLDIGANHGYYALVMAGAVGKNGRVAAFEPNYKLVNLVSKSLEVNGFNDRARVLPLAVSDRDGERVKLMVPKGNTGHASMYIGETDNTEVMEVETVTVDTFTADWPQVDFVKIDTEGAEEGAWLGMRETVRRNPNIVIVLEFGVKRYPDPKAFLLDIQAEGFKLRYVDYDGQAKDISIDRCLSERVESYWDLYLSRS